MPMEARRPSASNCNSVCMSIQTCGWAAAGETGVKARTSATSAARMLHKRFPLTRIASIPFEGRVALAMEIAIAEGRSRNAGALHEEAHIELVRHAHAAMHLQAFIGYDGGDIGEARLGDARNLRHVIAALLRRGKPVEHDGAAKLDLREEIGHAVLQRLEGADHLAELLALLEIGKRGVEGLLHQAEHFSGKADAADIEHL